ncbi:PP-loop family protein [Prevotellaceae bacterium HUN156]|nr:PP-loop family protein [Prevotellaceae bacterium HUN156]
MTLEEKLWKTFNKALGQYQLIDEDDKILVGLSGGKDSLFLLEMLVRRQHILKPRFTLEALHVRMTNVQYETDTTYLQSFCDHLGVPLHIITTSFSPAPTAEASVSADAAVPSGAPSAAPVPADAPVSADAGVPSSAPVSTSGPVPASAPVPAVSTAGAIAGSKKPACFLCSWQRRKQLFNLAQELNCTKIAFGHHQDDIIHTALMNLTFQGHFSTMPAKLKMRKMPLTIIRPLCLCQEDDIRQYAEEHHYEKQIQLCPYEHDTNRTTAQALFQHMQQLSKEARYSIWHALESDEKLVEY